MPRADPPFVLGVRKRRAANLSAALLLPSVDEGPVDVVVGSQLPRGDEGAPMEATRERRHDERQDEARDAYTLPVNADALAIAELVAIQIRRERSKHAEGKGTAR